MKYDELRRLAEDCQCFGADVQVEPDVIRALLDELERLRDLIYRWKDVYERGFLNSDFQPLYDETFDMLNGRPIEATP